MELGARRKIIPECSVHIARWIRDGAAAFDAAQMAPVPPGPSASALDDDGDASAVADLSRLLGAAHLPQAARAALVHDVLATGAVHVQELTRQDWEELPAWQSLKPLECRRILKFIQP